MVAWLLKIGEISVIVICGFSVAVVLWAVHRNEQIKADEEDNLKKYVSRPQNRYVRDSWR